MDSTPHTDDKHTPETIEEAQRQVRKPLRTLLRRYVREYWHYLILSNVAGLTANLLWLLPPLVIGIAFDAVFLGNESYRLPLVPDALLPDERLAQFALSLGILIAATALAAGLWMTSSWVRTLVALRVQHSVRTSAYASLQSLDIGFFDRHRTGELMSVLNNDVNRLEGFLRGTIQQATSALFILLGVAVYMLWLHWQLALVAFTVPVIIGAVNVVYARHIEPLHLGIMEGVADVSARIENNISGIEVIKMHTQEAYELDRVAGESASHRDASWIVARSNIIFSNLTRLLNGAATPFIFAIGGYWLLVGPPLFFTQPMSGAALLAFLMYMGWFSGPLGQLTGLVDQFSETKAAARRVLAARNISKGVSDPGNPVELTEIRGDVRFEGVAFQYPGSDEVAINHVELTANRGELIGIVGPTGAGKTTVAKLLLRYYDPDSGVIQLDGYDIRDLRLKGLRDAIGYVGQHPYLFDGTISENIAYSKPSATEEELISAAERAGAHEFISNLEEGYESTVGEGGQSLSGGQRQRISIARAILSDPRILVLDEATSHVDYETERVIQSNLRMLGEDRTVIAIAHRLSTIRGADEILVMDEGRIVERGTHDQLREHDGVYARLWSAHAGEIAVK